MDRKKVDESNLRWVTWLIEVQHTIKKIKIELPYDPAIPLVNIRTK